MRKTYRIKFSNHALHLFREHKADDILMMFLGLEYVQTCLHLLQMFRMRIGNYVFVVDVFGYSQEVRIEYWQI